VGKLEEVLPDELKRSAVAFGNELVLPFAEASAAILIATDHQVAILGVDALDGQTIRSNLPEAHPLCRSPAGRNRA
jgi:hypothetical protein